jgi:hypothetical protein
MKVLMIGLLVAVVSINVAAQVQNKEPEQSSPPEQLHCKKQRPGWRTSRPAARLFDWGHGDDPTQFCFGAQRVRRLSEEQFPPLRRSRGEGPQFTGNALP